MMQVKTIKMPIELIEAWRKKYNGSGDSRIRELMLLDLKGSK